MAIPASHVGVADAIPAPLAGVTPHDDLATPPIPHNVAKGDTNNTPSSLGGHPAKGDTDDTLSSPGGHPVPNQSDSNEDNHTSTSSNGSTTSISASLNLNPIGNNMDAQNGPHQHLISYNPAGHDNMPPATTSNFLLMSQSWC